MDACMLDDNAALPHGIYASKAITTPLRLQARALWGWRQPG
jgi:hypothetical protein